MGTQQILLIVLSVVVVGIAVAVGITMFQQQAVNSARQSIMSDLNNYAAQAMAWYKMPASMGGGAQSDSPDAGDLREYLGFTEGDTSDELENENATYSLSITGTTVTFESVAKEGDISDPAGDGSTETNPDLDVDLSTGTITPHPKGKAAAA